MMKTHFGHKALIAISSVVLLSPLTLSASDDNDSDNGGQACDGQKRVHNGGPGVGEGRGEFDLEAYIDAKEHARNQARNGTDWCNVCPDGDMCTATWDVEIHWTGEVFWEDDDQFGDVLVDLPFDGWTLTQTCASCD